MSFTIFWRSKIRSKGGVEVQKTKKYSSRHGKPQKKNDKMPMILGIGSVLILLIAAFFVFQKKPSAYTPEVTGGPSLKVDKEKVDLGEMKLGSTAQVSFEITNVGDQPLRFSKAPFIEVKEGC